MKNNKFIIPSANFCCAVGAIGRDSDAADFSDAVPGTNTRIVHDAWITAASGLALHLFRG